MLREKFGPKSSDATGTGEKCTVVNFVICRYLRAEIIKVVMGRECGTYGEKRVA